MNEQLASVTIEAKRESWRRLGSVPGCIALGCADIGTAELPSGERVIITWGRNLPREQQEWFASHTHFQPIHLGADDGSAELVIPAAIADKLVAILGP